MTSLDLESLLRLGDPEERAWRPPDFRGIRARAASFPAERRSRTWPSHRLVNWLATVTVVVAVAMAVNLLVATLQPAGSGGASPSEPSPITVPTLSVADRAAVAQAMDVPPAQVLATEDGAVAVRWAGSTISLLLAARNPAASGGWVVRTIAGEPAAGTRTEPGMALSAVACSNPGLVRSVYIFGELGHPDVAGPLTLLAAPVPVSLDALGGDLVNGLFLFAVQGPVASGTYLWVTGPDAPHISHPGLPSVLGYGSQSVPVPQTCAVD